MTTPTPASATAISHTAEPHTRTPEEKRVLTATLVGTTIEWYDFFIYAQAAGLVFASQFFAPLSSTPVLAQIFSWLSLGLSFLFRPFGAAVAGYLGDKYGRKIVLAITLIIMGVSTSLIGLLPTYATIGVAAPILLVVLRIFQGISAGGEWGGAALLSVEHAPKNQRGLYGAYPQLGVPLGLVIATSIMLILTSIVGKDAYVEWAWRIPFLISIVLVVVGIIVRSRVEESPVFKEIRERAAESSAPLGELLKNHPRLIIRAALIFAANNACGYLVIAFFGSYARKTLEMPATPVLIALTLTALVWAALTLWSGRISDERGRTQAFTAGYILLILAIIPTILLIETRNIYAFGFGLMLLMPGLALSYGPQSALYAELFPREIRYSGVSIGYALGAILGGAFAPLIAEYLLGATGASWTIGVYIIALSMIAIAALALTPKDLNSREL